jgi:hypothetical protein
MQKNVTEDDYEQWWIKWHRTLIVGAALGIVADLAITFYLVTYQFPRVFYVRYLLNFLVGALFGFSAILLLASNPKLRTKLVKYAFNRH